MDHQLLLDYGDNPLRTAFNSPSHLDLAAALLRRLGYRPARFGLSNNTSRHPVSLSLKKTTDPAAVYEASFDPYVNPATRAQHISAPLIGEDRTHFLFSLAHELGHHQDPHLQTDASLNDIDLSAAEHFADTHAKHAVMELLGQPVSDSPITANMLRRTSPAASNPYRHRLSMFAPSISAAGGAVASLQRDAAVKALARSLSSDDTPLLPGMPSDLSSFSDEAALIDSLLGNQNRTRPTTTPSRRSPKPRIPLTKRRR